MTQEIHHLSEQEPTSLIIEASKALEQKRQQAHRETIAQMKALAVSIGMDLVLNDEAPAPVSRKGTKVPVKYRDPANPEHAWTGRGVRPKWSRAYLEQGRSTDEFWV